MTRVARAAHDLTSALTLTGVTTIAVRASVTVIARRAVGKLFVYTRARRRVTYPRSVAGLGRLTFHLLTTKARVLIA